MTHLRLVTSNPVRDNDTDIELCAGRAQVGLPYQVKFKQLQRLGDDSVIAGNYILNNEKAVLEPVQAQPNGYVKAYFWQRGLGGQELQSLRPRNMQGQTIARDDKLLSNRALLQSDKLIGPNIITLSERPALSITPECIIQFSTDAGAAKLGEIRLIDSSRFITLSSGKTVPIICTDPAQGQALLLTHDQSTPVMTQNFIQPHNTSETYLVRRSVNQYLPNFFNGEKVVCVTVLEHVTSYFMQKLTASAEAIWTPVLSPISWGWSVRAEHHKGDWNISKSKVMRPTQHGDGLELPTWSTNVREQTDAQWQSFLNQQTPTKFAVSAPFFDSLDFNHF